MKCCDKTMKISLQFGSSSVNSQQSSVVPGLVLTLTFLIQQQISSSLGFINGHHGVAHVGYFPDELTVTWENLEFQHLSSLNGPTFHSNGFHVINVTFPGRNSSYIMHLSKTQGLFHQEQLGITVVDASHLECFYSGIITEVTGSRNATTDKGIVSLSTCHHEMGFEGIILLPHEQYYIVPHQEKLGFPQENREDFREFVKRSTSSSAANRKPTVPHKAYKVSARPRNKRVDEVLRVPPEELLKASQNQSHNQDGLENEDPEESDSPSLGGADSVYQEDNELAAQLIDNEGCDDLNCKVSLPPVMAALSTDGKAKPKKSTQKQKKPAGKVPIVLPKAQVVEIAVFTDVRLYKIWQNRYSKDAKNKMNQYVLAVINNMNALYKQPSMTESINFRLVHLEVQTSKPSNLKEYKGHATKYLKSFCSYAAEKNQKGRYWDHALLLTGFDLQEGGSNATAGIAWFSTMCINGYSCSLIEGSTFGSTFITSHEIGHSLGMEHDGTGSNIDCDPDSFIMSPSTGGGKTDWSPCSVKNMKEFITGGYQENPAPACIFKRGSRAGKAIKFSGDALPGQQFSATDQCSAECKQCTPYINPTAPYDDMCHLLYCQEIKGRFKLIRSTHPALEGTVCGIGKTCRIGKCE